MSSAASHLLALHESDRQTLETWLTEFEQSWDADRLDAVTRVLPPRSSPLRLPLLVELVRHDLRRRWRGGLPMSVEWYLLKYAELAADNRLVLELVVTEFEERRGSSSPPSLAEAERRFPQLSDTLRRRLGAGESRAAGSTPTPRPASRASLGAPSGGYSSGVTPHGNDRLDVPERLGKFHIIRRLGGGGMGTVYEAIDTHLERRVALKIPRLGAEEGAEMVRRFRVEARAAATVRHPYICPVYETDSVNGIHYLVMAFIEGEPLTVLVPDHRPAAPGRAAGVIRQLAEGMAEAHASGVLHRDLKPLNILLDRHGQPVIVDFGLARRMTGVNPQLTAEGEVLGTPAYMAPEQVHATGNIDGRCDVYSLGVILYELLAGRVPYEGPLGSVLAQVIQGKPAPPSSLNPDIPPALEGICLKAMAHAPADRYQSMTDLADALVPWEEERPKRFGASHSVIHLPEPPTRRRWPRVVGALLLLATLAGGGGALGLFLMNSGHLDSWLAALRGGAGGRQIETQVDPAVGEVRPVPVEQPAVIPAVGNPPAVDPLAAAQAAVDRGDMAAAVALAGTALAQNREPVRALLVRSAAHTGLGEPGPAVADASEAIRLDPGNAAAFLRRARARLRSERPDLAVADATEAARLDPARAPLALVCRAEAQLTSTAGDRDVEAAVADCDQAVAGDAGHAAAYALRGLAQGLLHRFTPAAADFDRAARLDPSSATVPAYRAAVATLAGDPDRAVRDSEAALALDPHLPPARLARARALQQMLLSDEALADAREAVKLDRFGEEGYVTLVNILTARGDHEAALAALSEVVHADPTNAVARCFRGEVHLLRREAEKAVTEFAEAARLNPAYCRAWSGLVNAYRLKNDLATLATDLAAKITAEPKRPQLRRAASDLARADKDLPGATAAALEWAKLEPGNPLAHQYVAAALRDGGDLDRAATEYDELIRSYPRSAGCRLERGHLFRAAGNLPKAFEEYAEAVRLGPEEKAQYDALADTAAALSAADQAEAVCTDVLRGSPRNHLALLCRGMLARERGDAGRATADLCAAVRAEPRATWAYDALTPVWAAGDRAAEGMAFYADLVTKNPDLPLPHAYRAALHAAGGRSAEFLADAAEAIKLAPRRAWPLVNRGNWYRTAKQPDLAVADFAAAARLEPADEPASAALRAVASQDDRVEAVLTALGEVIRAAPRIRRPYITRAEVAEAGKRPELAMADYEEALRLGPCDAEAAAGLARAAVAAGKPGPALDFCAAQLRRRRWDDHLYLARGRIFLAGNDTATAAADFAEVVRLNPRSAAGFAGKAQAAITGKQYEQARDDAVRAIKLDPDAPWEVYTTLNRASAATGDFAAAIACYTEVLGRTPRAEKPLWQRALAYEAVGNLPLALADLDVSARLTPNDKLVYVARGRIKMKLKQPRDAAEDFSGWVRLSPSEPAAYLSRGIARRDAGQLDVALEDFEQVIRLNPKLPRPFVEESKVFSKLGKFDKAIRSATAAITLTPDDAEAWFERAYAHSEQKEYQEAVNDYSKVIQLTPRRAAAFNNRGWNHAKLGQPALAVADYTRAIELDPDNPKAYENLIAVHEAEKSPAKAAEVRARLDRLLK